MKEAKAAGFREPREEHYGGEQIVLKGCTLVRNPRVAISVTAWKRRGFRVPFVGEDRLDEAHGFVTRSLGCRIGTLCWPVFRADQVVPIRRPAPPVDVPLLAAIWTINRTAKRYRTTASSCYAAKAYTFAGVARRKKERLYDLKDRALHHMVLDGLVGVTGYHEFGEGIWAEILKADGYTFHRPCPEPDDPPADAICDEIEAKPRSAREPRLLDAVFTVEKYLSAKGPAKVYTWPAFERPVGRRHFVDWSAAEDSDGRDFDEDEFSDDSDEDF